MSEQKVEIIEVEWVDSVISHGWEYKEDAVAKATDEVLACRTVGYLVGETSESLVLCMGEQPGSRSVLALCQIPLCAVKSRRVLGG